MYKRALRALHQQSVDVHVLKSACNQWVFHTLHNPFSGRHHILFSSGVKLKFLPFQGSNYLLHSNKAGQFLQPDLRWRPHKCGTNVFFSSITEIRERAWRRAGYNSLTPPLWIWTCQTSNSNVFLLLPFLSCWVNPSSLWPRSVWPSWLISPWKDSSEDELDCGVSFF